MRSSLPVAECSCGRTRSHVGTARVLAGVTVGAAAGIVVIPLTVTIVIVAATVAGVRQIGKKLGRPATAVHLTSRA